jgi:hypothetical protein
VRRDCASPNSYDSTGHAHRFPKAAAGKSFRGTPVTARGNCALCARSLERFSQNVIRPGQPLTLLEEALVPLYLSRRYQTEAAAKLVGGMAYEYSLRGDGRPLPQPVAAAGQRAALKAVLATLSPQALTLPEAVLKLLPARPYGYPRHRETFPSRTGVAFGALTPSETAANLVVGVLLNGARAARLLEQHARNPNLPGLHEVLDAVLAAAWKRRGRMASRPKYSGPWTTRP